MLTHGCAVNEKGKTDESQVFHVKRIVWIFKHAERLQIETGSTHLNLGEIRRLTRVDNFLHLNQTLFRAQQMVLGE